MRFPKSMSCSGPVNAVHYFTTCEEFETFHKQVFVFFIIIIIIIIIIYEAINSVEEYHMYVYITCIMNGNLHCNWYP